MRNHNTAKTNRELIYWRKMDLKAFNLYMKEIKKQWAKARVTTYQK